MKTYIIPAELVDRHHYSFHDKVTKKMMLWNKNANSEQWFHDVEPLRDSLAFSGKAHSLDDYFSKVIKLST